MRPVDPGSFSPLSGYRKTAFARSTFWCHTYLSCDNCSRFPFLPVSMPSTYFMCTSYDNNLNGATCTHLFGLSCKNSTQKMQLSLAAAGQFMTWQEMSPPRACAIDTTNRRGWGPLEGVAQGEHEENWPHSVTAPPPPPPQKSNLTSTLVEWKTSSVFS